MLLSNKHAIHRIQQNTGGFKHLARAMRLSHLLQMKIGTGGFVGKATARKDSEQRAAAAISSRASASKAFDFDVVFQQRVTNLARCQIQETRGFGLHPTALLHGPHQAFALGHELGIVYA